MTDETISSVDDTQPPTDDQPDSSRKAAAVLANRLSILSMGCGECGESMVRAVTQNQALPDGREVTNHVVECTECHETLVTNPGPAVLEAIREGDL